MNCEEGYDGYRESEVNDVEVVIHRGSDNEWHFSIEAGGTHVLQGVLNEESVRELRGECGNLYTSSSVFNLLEDAASDYDECDVFPKDNIWSVYKKNGDSWSYAGSLRAGTETKALKVANDQYEGYVKVERRA